jgi:two-component system response regulator HydG
MAEGKFRRDLYYRLNVYPIPLPPLREREADIMPLALHFLKKYSDELAKEVDGLSREAGRLLLRYGWPGNIRELENVIERAVILCQGKLVTPEELPLALRGQPRSPVWNSETFRLPPEGISLWELEKELMRQALDQAHHNKSQAAKLLGLSRTQLRTRLKHFGLEGDVDSPQEDRR